MLLARRHISTFKIRHTRWFSVFDTFQISFHIGYASNMETFDFLQFPDGNISHLASLTSWSLPRSRVKKMMMMMMMKMMMRMKMMMYQMLILMIMKRRTEVRTDLFYLFVFAVG
jgi:hypothetical protein